MKYQIWVVECAACGWDEHCGEDEGSIPMVCPSCGRSGDWWDEDAEPDEPSREPRETLRWLSQDADDLGIYTEPSREPGEEG